MLIFLYGIVSYAIGLGGLVYFILFLGSWSFLPVHISSKVPGPLFTALIVNLGLVLLFGIQHSVTARPAFKKKLTKFMPAAMERSTYVLLSGVMMLLFSFYWLPIEGELWHVQHPVAWTILQSIYLIGWVIVVISSFLINHFELFGLQQVYCNLKNRPIPDNSFTDCYLYKIVRHPLQMGVLIGIWVTPHMSMTHLLLAVSLTIYIFIGLHYEEKDLVRYLGDDYREYQRRVPKVIPLTGGKK